MYKNVDSMAQDTRWRPARAVFFFFYVCGQEACGRRAWHVYRMHNVTVAVAGTWTALAYFFFFSRASMRTTSFLHTGFGGSVFHMRSELK